MSLIAPSSTHGRIWSATRRPSTDVGGRQAVYRMPGSPGGARFCLALYLLLLAAVTAHGVDATADLRGSTPASRHGPAKRGSISETPREYPSGDHVRAEWSPPRSSLAGRRRPAAVLSFKYLCLVFLLACGYIKKSRREMYFVGSIAVVLLFGNSPVPHIKGVAYKPCDLVFLVVLNLSCAICSAHQPQRRNTCVNCKLKKSRLCRVLAF